MWQRTLVPTGTITLLLLTCGVARAQETAQPGDLARRTEKVRDLQEDIRLARILGQLKFSNAQLSRLLPTLVAAQKRQSDQDTRDARQLNAAQPGLEAARKQALSGRSMSGRAEEDFTRNLQSVEARRKELRLQLVASVRRELTTVATREQIAFMAFAGRDLNPVPDNQAKVRPVQPAPDGGPPGWISSYMDELRQMPPDQWEKWKEKFSERVAERRKPERLAQDQYFMSLGEVVRAMPDDQYTEQKVALAGRAFQDVNNIQQAGGGSAYLDEALNWFVDRCFLNPRIVPVIQEKTRSSGGG